MYMRGRLSSTDKDWILGERRSSISLTCWALMRKLAGPGIVFRSARATQDSDCSENNIFLFTSVCHADVCREGGNDSRGLKGARLSVLSCIFVGT